MSEDRAACHERNKAEAYRDPRSAEIERLSPCNYCFIDGEIDVDEDDLLVTARNKTSAKHLHRHERTGSLEWTPPSQHGPNLAYALRDPDVTSVAEAREKIEGGGD